MLDLTTIKNRHGILSLRISVKFSYITRYHYILTRISIENIIFKLKSYCRKRVLKIRKSINLNSPLRQRV